MIHIYRCFAGSDFCGRTHTHQTLVAFRLQTSTSSWWRRMRWSRLVFWPRAGADHMSSMLEKTPGALETWDTFRIWCLPLDAEFFPFFFVSLLFLSIFFFTGWMPTSPAGSYDGNWSLIVGCLPCVVGHHLQLVVFLIGSHLWLGNIGKKNRFQRITYPENDRMPSHVPQKRDHLQKRLHLPTLGFSPGYSCVLWG